MKTTPKNICNAFQAVHELSDVVLPFKAARGIAFLKKRLREEFDTVRDMESTLVEKYSGKSERGKYQFPDTLSAEAFAEEYDAMMHQQDDVSLPVVDLSAYTSMIRITPTAIEALEGLVIFEEVKDDGR